MPKILTDDFLISELHRFYEENDRVPTQLDLQGRFGYPSHCAYQNHFGSHNNALKAANLPLNQYQDHWQDGTETCCKCGRSREQTIQWYTKGLPKGQVICRSCYSKPDYKSGKLDKDTTVGKATISEQIVKNVLNLEEKHNCNFTCGFGYKVDLYHKDRYKYINVKDSKLYYVIEHNPYWYFNLTQKVTPDTYVMLGYDEDRKNILKVWITDAIDDLVYDEKTEKLKRSLSITNDIFSGLKKAKPWKVDPKPYNDMLHKMSQKRKETKGEECFLSDDDLRK